MNTDKKVLANRPKCDVRGCEQPAKYDCCTRHGGGWMYLCQKHYEAIGCKVKGLYTDLDKLAEKRHNAGLD